MLLGTLQSGGFCGTQTQREGRGTHRNQEDVMECNAKAGTRMRHFFFCGFDPLCNPFALNSSSVLRPRYQLQGTKELNASFHGQIKDRGNRANHATSTSRRATEMPRDGRKPIFYHSAACTPARSQHHSKN